MSMSVTIFGLIVMIIPLSLVLLFKDRFSGFITTITALTAFHLSLAVITQIFGVFDYVLIISIHVLLAIACLVILTTRRTQINKISFNVNWPLVLAVAIIGFQLWSAHYSYTGIINTINGPQEVVNHKYIYPYYSDEWVGVALINQTVESGSLPLTNPLWYNAHFPNPTFPFFSFLSEIFLILKLNPLTTYPILAILSGLLICGITYFILRKLGVSLPASLLSILSIPYIVNGANLPGIWYFIPFTMGLIVFLLGFLALVSHQKNSTLALSVLSIIFYPPIIIFSIPLIFYTLFKYQNKKIALSLIALLLTIFFTATILIFNAKNLSDLAISIQSLILRTNLQSGIPKFELYTIIPFWILLLSIVGITKVIRGKSYLLVSLTTVGLVFWLIYSSTRNVYVIEYQRVVVLTSILITILAGLGLQNILEVTRKRSQGFHKISDSILVGVILLIFLVVSPLYTRNSNWQKMVMQIQTETGITEFSPASPANNYLTNDDLKIFQGIRKARFIAPSWKGLVIGVATNNYPLESKPSTLTNKILSYSDFASSDCEEKIALAKKFTIDYAYSAPFSCEFFDAEDESPEGLILYKFTN